MSDVVVTQPAVAVMVAGLPVRPDRGSVGLDFSAVPYGRASFDVPLTADILRWIDPRRPQRLVVESNGRRFDLSIRGRRGQHRASGGQSITIDAATDEAMLIDYAPLTDDLTPFTLAGSLRAIVNYVLGVVIPTGVTLEPGPDADVRPYWRVVNLLRNPAVVGSAKNWTAGTGCTIHWVDEGTSGYVRAISTGTASGAVYAVDTTKQNLNATPGEEYTFSLGVRAGTIASAVRLCLRFLDVNGERIVDRAGPYTTVDDTEQRLTFTARAAANTSRVAPFFQFAAGESGRAFSLDNGMLHEGDARLPVPFFSGYNTDEGYSYVWQGPTDDSPSERIPLRERDPVGLIWAAGTSAWNFLESLAASVGMRLYCDEYRRWFLVNPATFTRAGTLEIAPTNTAEASDDITLGDPTVYATGVIVRYRWEDKSGVRRERLDVAGIPGLVRVVDIDRPYPGAGVASRILQRMSGRGRVQEATVVADWTATPGMQATFGLPGGPTQTEQLRAVEWGFSNGLMRVRTTALDPTT